MKHHSVIVGQAYGSLTVTADLGHRAEPSGHRRRWYGVNCACGKQYECLGERIRGLRKCRDCCSAARRSVAIGDRFDSLTVVGFERAGRRMMAMCRCDCGGRLRVRSCNLPKNITNNCGCEVRGKWDGVGDVSRTLFYRLKRNARIRGIQVDPAVSMSMLWELFLAQRGRCALTGLPIRIGRTAKDPGDASVDRIDSDRGYESGNVQWVHKDINQMKMDLPEDRFVELCRLVVARAARGAEVAA